MFKVRLLFIISLLLSILFTTVGSVVKCWAQTETSKDHSRLLIDKLYNIVNNHFNLYKHAYYRLSSISYVDSPLLPEPHMLKGKGDYQIWLDYPKYKIKWKSFSRLYSNGKLHEGYDYLEFIYNENQYIGITYDKDFMNIRGVHSRFNIDDKFKRHSIPYFNEMHNIYGEHLSWNYDFYKEKYVLFDLGNSKYHITYSNDYGNYSIYIYYKTDVAGENKVERTRLIVNRNNLIDPNMRLRDMPPYPKRFGIEPQTSIEQMIVDVHFEDYRFIDNIYVYTKLKRSEERLFSNGQKVSYIQDISLSDISFDKNKLKDVFLPNIPDGSVISILDQDGIEYIWRDGQIVKKVPQGVLEKLTGAGFEGGSLWSRGLVVILILLVLTLTVAAILYYRRRRNT